MAYLSCPGGQYKFLESPFKIFGVFLKKNAGGEKKTQNKKNNNNGYFLLQLLFNKLFIYNALWGLLYLLISTKSTVQVIVLHAQLGPR